VKTKPKSNKLSFLGGLAFVAMVTVLVVRNNQAIKQELTDQYNSFLTTTRKLINEYTSLVNKLNRISTALKERPSLPSGQ